MGSASLKRLVHRAKTSSSEPCQGITTTKMACQTADVSSTRWKSMQNHRKNSTKGTKAMQFNHQNHAIFLCDIRFSLLLGR